MYRKDLEKKWLELEAEIDRRGGDGKDFVAAMKDLYTIYDQREVTWLANLFDYEIGGFYYSNSARDNEKVESKGKMFDLLPDMESTLQATGFLISSGMIESYDEIPDWLREKLINFTSSLQDPDDGYIYHPQWGKDIPDYRRGRDTTWANAMQEYLKFKLPYPTAMERLAANVKAREEGKADENVGLPEHLQSPEAIIAYFDKQDFVNNAYVAGSWLASQGGQIIAAGLADVVVEYLNKFQDPETGIWGADKGYMAINGALKISAFYSQAGRPIKNADKIARVAMECICSEDPAETVCFQYNVWFTIYNMLENLQKFGGEDGKKQIDAILLDLVKLAPAGIRATKEKVKVFKKDDGPFSYLPDRTAHYSQDVPVAIPYSNEGDVNATIICTTGTVAWLHHALFLNDFIVPLFTHEDFELFLETILKNKDKKK